MKVQYYVSPSGANPVSDFLDSLGKPQQAKLLRIFGYIQLYGLLSVMPHIKKLAGTPLWEIRILGKDNLRVIYVSLAGNGVLLLHGFIKKTQKTSAKEIAEAFNRFNEWITSHS